jgi:hypothetical protein
VGSESTVCVKGLDQGVKPSDHTREERS